MGGVGVKGGGIVFWVGWRGSYFIFSVDQKKAEAKQAWSLESWTVNALVLYLCLPVSGTLLSPTILPSTPRLTSPHPMGCVLCSFCKDLS